MIYVVEDDGSIRELVVYTLNNVGLEAAGFADGDAFFREIKEKTPSLVLLDIMLPGEDGISILGRLRGNASTKKLPVIMMTAKGSEYDKVLGLDSGADDYIVKPFGMMEMISRVKAVLRRSGGEAEDERYVCGSVELNVAAHSVTVKGNFVDLTLKEFEVLRLLMKNSGIVMTRDRLLSTIWGYDFDGETRTVDVHMRSLRQKLGVDADIIDTVRGVGYRIGIE